MIETRQRDNPVDESKRHSQVHDGEGFSKPEHFAIGLAIEHSISENRDSEGLGGRLEQASNKSIPGYL
jgi:hypothetical protein